MANRARIILAARDLGRNPVIFINSSIFLRRFACMNVAAGF